MKPSVRNVVERLDDTYMAPKGPSGTMTNQRVIGKEHAGEDNLKGYLSPHVENNPNEVVITFTVELFHGELVIVVILIT